MGVGQSCPSRSALIVITKNRVDRLRRTLPRLASWAPEAIVVDDSTSMRARSASSNLAARLGAMYHGPMEQKRMLSDVPTSLLDGMVTPLGTPGWTLGMCRNYAVLLGRSLSFERFVMVDDDILLPSRRLLWTTLGLLSHFDYVGARTAGLPDDSVVGHVARRHGIVQYDFITGQYLGMRTGIQRAFFPNVYNEDLIFLLQVATQSNLARHGVVRQLQDGSAGPKAERALFQEIGEAHFEGGVRAAMSRRTFDLCSPALWRTALRFRRACLRDILERENERGSLESVALLRRVLALNRTFRPLNFALYYRRYFETIPRWIELQEAVG